MPVTPTKKPTEKELADFIKESLDFSESLVKEDGVLAAMELFAFEGFNPEKTFVLIMRKIKANAKVKQSLLDAVVFGLTRGFGRGKNMARIIERTNPEGRERLNKMVDDLGIVTKKSGENAVTFDRIMAAFPRMTYEVWINIKEVAQPYVPGYDGKLDPNLRYPGSPSSMSKKEWEQNLEPYLDWSERLQDIWSQNRPDKRPFDREQTRKFAELQYNNRLFPMSER